MRRHHLVVIGGRVPELSPAGRFGRKFGRIAVIAAIAHRAAMWALFCFRGNSMGAEASCLVDLRSDTVTRPTPAMRAAMAAAEVGDDVYGDDPTVNRLQCGRRSASDSRRPVLRHRHPEQPRRADGALRPRRRIPGRAGGAHLQVRAGRRRGARQHPAATPGERARRHDRARTIARAIKPQDIHFARTRLLALENTIGGRVLPPSTCRGDRTRARPRTRDPSRRGAALQCDRRAPARGARRGGSDSTPCRSACPRGWAPRRDRCCSVAA